jgi:pimeloyl-ACP methyl ester carboxylesterase
VGETLQRGVLSFEGEEGIRLYADAVGSPAAPPVLLLHGGGQTRHSWSQTAESLAREGWYAVSVDLRGHGDSEWSPTGDYTHPRFTGDAIRMAQSFSAPPVLVGASLGGISSLLAIHAADAPIARALVLVDIATRMEEQGASRIMSFMAGAPDGFESIQAAADAVTAYNPHRPRPKDLSGLAKNLRQREDGRYRWHWDPAFIEGRHTTTERMHEPELLDRAARALTLPTLLVRGRQSDLLSAEGAQEFLDLVPHARFTDVSGAGHMVAGDKNDVFTAAVMTFLRESEPREPDRTTAGTNDASRG